MLSQEKRIRGMSLIAEQDRLWQEMHRSIKIRALRAFLTILEIRAKAGKITPSVEVVRLAKECGL